MTTLRLEAEETAGKNEELAAKVKTLEQENLSKEQEITSLSHKNQLLESEVEKHEATIKDLKRDLEEHAGAGTQNEGLQRRLQLLEEEAEESDKNLRETNEKYGKKENGKEQVLIVDVAGYDRRTSKPVTTNAKSKLSRRPVISGRRNTKRWPRSTKESRRSWRTSTWR